MSEQARYQVRFDFGVAGAHAVGADADVIVWVDALGSTPLDVSGLPEGCATRRPRSRARVATFSR